jgi:hypothetical protein
MNYIALGHWDLMIAASLLLINGGLSLALDLGLVRSLLIATIRMTVQLLLGRAGAGGAVHLTVTALDGFGSQRNAAFRW